MHEEKSNSRITISHNFSRPNRSRICNVILAYVLNQLQKYNYILTVSTDRYYYCSEFFQPFQFGCAEVKNIKNLFFLRFLLVRVTYRSYFHCSSMLSIEQNSIGIKETK